MAEMHDANPALFERRRKAIETEMRQIQADAEHWNRLHPDEEQIVINMDLTAEVEALKRNGCETQPGICAFPGCGHPYSSHAPFNDGNLCSECGLPWEFDHKFHRYQGPCLAGGVFDPQAEREAYERAMGREASE